MRNPLYRSPIPSAEYPDACSFPTNLTPETSPKNLTPKTTPEKQDPRIVGLTGTPEKIDKVREREIFIDNLLVRIHFIIVMIRWTGLAPWEFQGRVPSRVLLFFFFIDLQPLET